MVDLLHLLKCADVSNTGPVRSSLTTGFTSRASTRARCSSRPVSSLRRGYFVCRALHNKEIAYNALQDKEFYNPKCNFCVCFIHIMCPYCLVLYMQCAGCGRVGAHGGGLRRVACGRRHWGHLPAAGMPLHRLPDTATQMAAQCHRKCMHVATWCHGIHAQNATPARC